MKKILTLLLVLALMLTSLPAKGYIDDRYGHWYSDAMMFMQEESIIVGCGDGTFRPNTPVTKGEIMVMLSNNMKDSHNETPVSVFEDVDEDRFYFEALQWAYD